MTYNLKIKKNNIYKSIKSFEKEIGLKVDTLLYYSIRRYIYKNYCSNDYIHFIHLGKYLLIKYKDYNNFDWKLTPEKTPSISGGFTKENYKVTKLAKGLLLIKDDFKGDEIYGNVNKETFEKEGFVSRLKCPMVFEILHNIFYYEYPQYDEITIRLETNAAGNLELPDAEKYWK